MNLSILDKNIGKNYDEATMGCLSPIFLLHPELPKYKFDLDEKYFLPIIEKHTEEIPPNERKQGDLLMIKVRNDYHFGIFKEPDMIYHCTKNSKLRLSKVDFYERYVVGVFRLKQHLNMKGENKNV